MTQDREALKIMLSRVIAFIDVQIGDCQAYGINPSLLKELRFCASERLENLNKKIEVSGNGHKSG